MKRQAQVIGMPGVYHYSTSQIGTNDLPVFIAECAYHKHHVGKRQQRMLNNINHGQDDVKHINWRGQLARAYGQLKQANKHH